MSLDDLVDAAIHDTTVSIVLRMIKPTRSVVYSSNTAHMQQNLVAYFSENVLQSINDFNGIAADMLD